ncbi:MAG: putative toxin-antitoxin system toxin component, PIN family [Endomicrobium sp.]|jgi:putative PIN family toxin of toxin-antitoxin system|nr:putative toxin-antitoxin system toxin component, PIN family [Endomicrobium sp.]
MKIVLDTNVFVSAFCFEGNPKLVLERVIEGINRRAVCFKRDKGRNFFCNDSSYENISISVRTKEKLKDVSGDIKDDKILECTLEAKAEYIVTGDKDLLSLESFKNIKISYSENYLKIVNKE